jgi:hypothetical protein
MKHSISLKINGIQEVDGSIPFSSTIFKRVQHSGVTFLVGMTKSASFSLSTMRLGIISKLSFSPSTP